MNRITLTSKFGIPKVMIFLKIIFCVLYGRLQIVLAIVVILKDRNLLTSLVISAITNLNKVFKIHLILCALAVYMKNQKQIFFFIAPHSLLKGLAFLSKIKEIYSNLL